MSTDLSLCATNYNSHPITAKSVASIVDLTSDLDREVVVVDNFSGDGSFEILETLSLDCPLRVIRRQSSRGEGRQIAFENSRGRYIATFDLDTVYNEHWGRLVHWAVATRINFGLSCVYSQVYPRELLTKVGGWRGFQYWEDVDLWIRLAGLGAYRTYPLVCGENFKRVPGRGSLERVLRLYAKCRDKVAIADWIPLSLYIRGYCAIPWGLGRMHQIAVFLPAFISGKMKRKRLCGPSYDTSLVRTSSINVDIGLVPSSRLMDTNSLYNSAEGCRLALERGDLGFLPGAYD